MNLRSKLTLSVAAATFVCGLAMSASAQAPADPAAPTPAPAAVPGPAAGQPLTDVQNANTTLVGAKVKDSKGEAVGEVKSVKLGPDGKVASVDITVGKRTIALEASTLTYAQADNSLTSAKTKAEITK